MYPQTSRVSSPPPPNGDLSLCRTVELFAAIHGCDRRAVSHHVRVAVRDDDDVTGFKGYRAAVLFDPHIPPPFGYQMIDDHMLGDSG
jgi:hypothetical protein